MSDRHLYSRLLLAKGNGYPLSYPQPSDDLLPACRERGIEIGDVGVLTSDGSFDVFFNICRDRDDPVNRYGLPPGFKPVGMPASGDLVSRESYYRPGSHVSNTAMKQRRLDANVELDNVQVVFTGAVIEVTTVSKQAAVLLLPDGASRLDLRFLNKFRQVALKHAKNWYAFVIGLGSMLENDELYLVTGVDKSASWAVAAAESRSEDYNINLKLRAAHCAARSFTVAGSYAWQWEAGCEFADFGPRRPPGEPSSLRNQTVFLRGFRIAIHSLVWRKIAQAVAVVDAKPTTFLSRRWFTSFIQFATSGSSGDPAPNPPAIGTPHNEAASIELNDRVKNILNHSSSGNRVPISSRRYYLSRPLKDLLKLLSPLWRDADSTPPSTTASDAIVIHDTEWMSVLKEDEEVIPSHPELLERVLNRYKIIRTSSAGAYLQNRNENAEKPFSMQMASTTISFAIFLMALLWPMSYTPWPIVVAYFDVYVTQPWLAPYYAVALKWKRVIDLAICSFAVFVLFRVSRLFARVERASTLSIANRLSHQMYHLDIEGARDMDGTAPEQVAMMDEIKR
ncbi:hypothetical protein C8R46DRAFT_1227418 [Mycena filopes]|nr:hypothetical protein C8R46DRAFT_1227418 [Mycena filopes]